MMNKQHQAFFRIQPPKFMKRQLGNQIRVFVKELFKEGDTIDNVFTDFFKLFCRQTCFEKRKIFGRCQSFVFASKSRP